MIEQFILGLIQGIAEWIPVSSEGMIVLAKQHLFHSTESIETIIKQALLLHLGTFFAALIYFAKDVGHLIKTTVTYKSADQADQKTFLFLLISTVISGGLGFIILKGLGHLTETFDATGKGLTLGVAGLLLITAFLELKAKKPGYRREKEITIPTGIILGVAQGMAVLPGLSRSGLTVSMLLLQKFDKATALRLSFLMSLPIVLAGNILLNFEEFTHMTIEKLVGIASAFIFGLLTIHLLLKIAEKINFGYFVLFFAALTLLSVVI